MTTASCPFCAAACQPRYFQCNGRLLSFACPDCGQEFDELDHGRGPAKQPNLPRSDVDQKNLMCDNAGANKRRPADGNPGASNVPSETQLRKDTFEMNHLNGPPQGQADFGQSQPRGKRGER